MDRSGVPNMSKRMSTISVVSEKARSDGSSQESWPMADSPPHSEGHLSQHTRSSSQTRVEGHLSRHTRSSSQTRAEGHLSQHTHSTSQTQVPPRAFSGREWNRSLNDLHAESPLNTPGYSLSIASTPTASTLFLPYNRQSFPLQSPLNHQSQDSFRPLYPDGPQTYFKKDWVKQGVVAQLQDRDDDGFMPRWKRALYWLAPLLAVTTLALYWIYFALRIRFVISAQRKTRTTFPLAWVFIAVEISVAIPIFLQSFWSVFILKKRHRPKLRLIGNDVPTVDVFITCCGEDDDLILDTVRAACDVDYPQDRFRVVVLDDGKAESLQKAVEDMQSTFSNLHYRCRPKFPGVPHHFKAGNLNYGLEEVHSMDGGAGEFMAALDADMIPERDWLRAIMPHMLIDEKMALACPPQLFYNVPPGDPLCQSLDFFVHVSEPIKDALGVAWCTGSGYVVRRTALDEIGCFPCGSLAEDVATSTLLLGRGWKTAYIHESLQFGTVPDSYGSHLKQRTRWAIGTVDTSFKLKFCLWGDKIKKMTFAQRMSTFIYAISGLFNIVLTLSLFAMPVVLISGKALVAYANDTQLRWLIRACFAALVSNRLSEIVLFLPSGYATGQRGSRAQLWMSPYIALTIVRAFILPTWLGGKAQAFKPSGSLKSNLNERNSSLRAPLHRRLRVILFNYHAWFHISYVYFCLAAVILSSYRGILERTIRMKLTYLLTHAGWPPMTWIIVISAFWIPITYACDPPNMPDREALLERDPKTGVAHPTHESKRIAFEGQTALFEFEYIICTLFTAFVFAASFFYI